MGGRKIQNSDILNRGIFILKKIGMNASSYKDNLLSKLKC